MTITCKIYLEIKLIHCNYSTCPMTIYLSLPFLFWKWEDITILLMKETSSYDMTLWKTAWQFPIHIHVPNDPAVHGLDISLKETRPGVHTDLCTNDYSLVHNSQQLETAQMSISWGMDVQAEVHLYRGILYCAAVKRNKLPIHRSLMWKNQDTKDYILQSSIHMNSRKENYSGKNQINGCQGLGEGAVAAKGTWKYFPMMKMSYIYMDMDIVIKSHQTAHWKLIIFLIVQICLLVFLIIDFGSRNALFVLITHKCESILLTRVDFNSDSIHCCVARYESFR